MTYRIIFFSSHWWKWASIFCFSEAEWPSVSAGCEDGTHFALCAVNHLWVISRFLCLGGTDKGKCSDKQMSNRCYTIADIGKTLFKLFLNAYIYSLADLIMSDELSIFIIVLNTLLYCGHTQGDWTIFFLFCFVFIQSGWISFFCMFYHFNTLYNFMKQHKLWYD